MKCAAMNSALAKEGHRDGTVRRRRRRQPGPDGDGNACPDDAVCPQDPKIRLREVHRAPAPAAGAGLATEQFSHHRVRVGTLSKTMPVAAMGRGDQIAGRSAAQAPAATASCPIEVCTNP